MRSAPFPGRRGNSIAPEDTTPPKTLFASYCRVDSFWACGLNFPLEVQVVRTVGGSIRPLLRPGTGRSWRHRQTAPGTSTGPDCESVAEWSAARQTGCDLHDRAPVSAICNDDLPLLKFHLGSSFFQPHRPVPSGPHQRVLRLEWKQATRLILRTYFGTL